MFSSDENDGSVNLNGKSSLLYDENLANNKEIFPNGPISLPLINKITPKNTGFMNNEEQPSKSNDIDVGNLLKNDEDEKNNKIKSNINKNEIENESEEENNEINDNEENEEKEDEEIQKEKIIHKKQKKNEK